MKNICPFLYLSGLFFINLRPNYHQVLKYPHILYTIVLILFLAVPSYASQFTVVLDPGHGGKDLGACGLTACEKDINLDVAKRVGRLIAADGNTRVVYTRNNDVFVDLHQRAACANEIKADLFISIHCNSMGRTTAGRERMKGAVTYVMGLDAIGENLEVAHRENSVIAMEEDFTTRYQAFDVNSPESHVMFELNQRRHMQRSIEFAQLIQQAMVKVAGRADAGVHQGNFIVLAHTAMPAVLIELDFISNPECEKFLSSTAGADMMARAIVDALNKFRNHSVK